MLNSIKINIDYLLDDFELRTFLFNWWKENIDNAYAYHGTTSFYLNSIREFGMDPNNRPYENRILISLKLIKRASFVFRNVKNNKINFNDLTSNRNISATYWTFSQDIARKFSIKHAKEGGELLMGVKESIELILVNYSRNKLLRLILRKKELSYLEKVLVWIKSLSIKHDSVILRTKLSHPSFNKSCSFVTDNNEFAPCGDFDNFFNMFREYLFQTTKYNKKTWNKNEIINFFQGNKVTDDSYEYGIPAREKILFKDIELIS